MISAPFPIRPGMDVFNADQSRYIGMVIDVIYRGPTGGAGTQEGGVDLTGSETAPLAAPMVHEEGHVASTMESPGSRMLGEEMGPVPTIAAGNSGPVKQSAKHDYATRPEGDFPAVACLVVRPGRINLGLLTRPRYIPVQSIRSMSMERIVVDEP